jgi:hypothetical protein
MENIIDTRRYIKAVTIRADYLNYGILRILLIELLTLTSRTDVPKV